MRVVQVHLCVDVRREGDAIRGTVTVGDGDIRRFSGRLGLFSTIDDAIEGLPPLGGPRETEDVDG